MPRGYLTACLDDLLAWARRASLWRATFFGACCSAGACGEDLATSLAPIEVAPEGADLLVVVGAVTRKHAPLLAATYDRMPKPCWVVALGACASAGGPFAGYGVLPGAASVVPVDVYVPGCPPAPSQIRKAMQSVRDSIGERGLGLERS